MASYNEFEFMYTHMYQSQIVNKIKYKIEQSKYNTAFQLFRLLHV